MQIALFALVAAVNADAEAEADPYYAYGAYGGYAGLGYAAPAIAAPAVAAAPAIAAAPIAAAPIAAARYAVPAARVVQEAPIVQQTIEPVEQWGYKVRY